MLSQALAAFGPFPQKSHFVVGLSGGADSMALALQMKEWAQEHNHRLSTVTVNHGLRPESAEEANQVAQWMEKRGIPHTILTWSPPQNPVPHEIAREARYDLLLHWCKVNQATYLLTAHHQEDVAETLIMRFMNGSGVDGLCGIAPRVQTPFVTLLRPFLTQSKESLKAYLRFQGQTWVEDPSNTSDVHKRSRIRQFMESEGLTANRFKALAHKFQRVRSFLNQEKDHWMKINASLHPSGFYVIGLDAFLKCHGELQRRILEDALKTISGHIYAPGYESVRRVIKSITPNFKGKTLHGCQVSLWRGNLLISREVQAMQKECPLPAGVGVHWDNRFQIQIDAEGGSIAPLGEKNWSLLNQEEGGGLFQSIPPVVRATLPAFYLDNQLISVPHVNFNKGNIHINMEFFPKGSLFNPDYEVDLYEIEERYKYKI